MISTGTLIHNNSIPFFHDNREISTIKALALSKRLNMNTKHSAFSSLTFYCLITFICLGLSSCESDPNRELERIIRVSLSDDQGIDENEWVEIRQMIYGNETLNNKYASDDDVSAFINSLCGRVRGEDRTPINCPPQINITDVANPSEGQVTSRPKSTSRPQKLAYSVYVENSGSMYGYFKGNSDFKNAFMDLITRLNRYGEDVNFYFVNNEINPVSRGSQSSLQQELEEFMTYLEPANEKKLRGLGNVSNSNLAKSLALVLDSLVVNRRPIILTSDFIFSLEDPKSKLASQKFSITNLITERDLYRDGYGFLIIKGTSRFNGNYFAYDRPNTAIRIDENRPYYTFVIAQNKNLVDFSRKYNLEGLDGYDNHYVIYRDDEAQAIPYGILKETGKIGRFQIAERGTKSIKSIEDIDFDRREGRVFQFSIGADFSNIPVSEAYLTNKDYYVVDNTGRPEFEVIDIKAIEDYPDIHRTDESRYLGSSTHIITLKSETLVPGTHNLTINLKKEIPEWISQSSTDDDTDIETNPDTKKQTFGFDYLVKGIVDAYKPVSNVADNYVELKLTLTR